MPWEKTDCIILFAGWSATRIASCQMETEESVQSNCLKQHVAGRQANLYAKVPDGKVT
jgi:hypothetical protein